MSDNFQAINCPIHGAYPYKTKKCPNCAPQTDQYKDLENLICRAFGLTKYDKPEDYEMSSFGGMWVFDDGKRAIDLTNLLEALIQYIEKREVDFANKCIKELLLFTAPHDRAMRDEAIAIIKTNLKGGNF